MACRWVHDREIGRWFLPDCWGGVNAGPDGCYCKAEEEPPDEVRDRLEELEARLARIEKLLMDMGGKT